MTMTRTEKEPRIFNDKYDVCEDITGNDSKMDGIEGIYITSVQKKDENSVFYD